MAARPTDTGILEKLNEAQAAAAAHGDGPLLVIAGAGTGKTRTLVHRVAHLLARGTDPARVMLLTFTRRAAAEMLRRVDVLLGQLADHPRAAQAASYGASKRLWGGTFHSMATRLLRIHGKSIGLEAGFTIHDRGDSEDLLDVVRAELGLAKTNKRFPKKGTCLAIYSNCVNSRRPLEDVLADTHPWCIDYADDLKRLCRAYVERKEAAAVLDYDDLLLFWRGLLDDKAVGDLVRSRFDCVLVDEYQDTNRLQSEILKLLRPDGRGLTVVGDDAQSIYSFRAATVRNILDFPREFPGTTIVKLEQNYRSLTPILAATNAIIGAARERFTKQLWSLREGGEKPSLVTCDDENEQAEYVVGQILGHREAGIDLRRQAVLFRASHHSILLEAELARRNVPFVKYGGLKFMETAHVKDLFAFLRLAENPRDVVAGTRLLMLLPGVGPKRARQLIELLITRNGDFASWAEIKPAAAAEAHWPKLVKLMRRLAGMAEDVAAQLQSVRKFYAPLLEMKYDNTAARLRDLEQLEQLAGRFRERSSLLAEMALDPPATSEDLAGDPHLDDDYLVLSTIHSAKGLEWDAVYVIHASDGNIPSDMATKSSEQIEEERRLFYVALTRAKDWLYVCHPQRYYHAYRGPFSDQYGYAPLTRFLTKTEQRLFERRVAVNFTAENQLAAPVSSGVSTLVRQAAKAMWS